MKFDKLNRIFWEAGKTVNKQKRDMEARPKQPENGSHDHHQH